MWPFLAFGSWFGVLAIQGGTRRISRFAWYLTFIIAVVFVGLRHRVGTDWFNYQYMIDAVDSAQDFSESISVAEPLYALLLKLGLLSGYGIYFANIITALVALGGVFALARRMPEPWTAVLAAIPYLVIVVGMSANRQFLAIGILMFLLSVWDKAKLPVKVGLILLAYGFHRSAAIFLIFVVLEFKFHVYLKAMVIAVLTLATLRYISSNEALDYYSNAYVTSAEDLESQGALAHIAQVTAPAILLFAISGLRRQIPAFPLIGNLAYAAIACLAMSFFYSTMADRLSLYLFPVSMFTWSYLPGVFQEKTRTLVRFGIALIMVGVLSGWLLFANEAESHLPYENALIVSPEQLDY